MKKLLIIVSLLTATMVHGQNAVVFCAQTNCPITITAPTDSATLFGLGTITGAKDSITGYVWKQVSGPTAAVIVSPTASQTVIRKLVPGSYTFALTVSTKLGGIQTIGGDIVTVAPAPPPPRTVTSLTFKLVNGLWIPSFVFGDGTTQ